MSTPRPTISTPLQIGPITLSHRVVMAPMTRLRSSDTHVPLDMARTYYAQRASTPGTLIITEATFTGASSRGRDANAPGIFTPDQIAQWRTVVDAVHDQGSFIFCQLWHVGRAARKHELRRLGIECVSSSAVPMPGGNDNDDQYLTPRAMTDHEIWAAIADFATAAKNAVIGAGFDGVEIHAANGYLIDQFTQSTCNRRDDGWGGTVETRARFCVEVVRAVSEAVGSQRTAVRLSPFSPFQGMGMDDPKPQFRYLIDQLRGMGLAYLHLVEPRVGGNVDIDSQGQDLDFALEAWDHAGPVILAGGFTPESARKTVEDGRGRRNEDIAIAFGRQFVSNPDLPRRILEGKELSPYHRETFYEPQSAVGYIDYEFAPT